MTTFIRWRATAPIPVAPLNDPVQEAYVAARRGLDWLQNIAEAKHGFQWQRINVDTLDVGSPSRCPLSQSSGLWFTEALGVALKDDPFVVSLRDMANWAGEHGFAVHNDYRYWFKDLDAAWRIALAEERTKEEARG